MDLVIWQGRYLAALCVKRQAHGGAKRGGIEGCRDSRFCEIGRTYHLDRVLEWLFLMLPVSLKLVMLEIRDRLTNVRR